MTTQIKERPILFTPAMAQAIADGRKTQTRRVVKIKGFDFRHDPLGGFLGPSIRESHNCIRHLGINVLVREFCPYGVPGDRLWVRESVCWNGGSYCYRGSYSGGAAECVRWRPSIHMPRAACRSVLEVVSVRVERVESITEADAIAEGFAGDSFITWQEDMANVAPPGSRVETVRDRFLRTFYDINKRAPEGSNPWVWVVEFNRIQEPKA